MAKQFFKDLPDTTTPLTASRLNGLLDGEEALGNIVVDSIRSKNMFDGVLLNGVYNDTTGEFTPSVSLCSKKIKIKSSTSYYLSGVTGSVRVHYWNNNTYVGNEVITAPNSFVSQGNITAFQFGGSTPHSNIQLEEGSTATNYMPYQNLDGMETYSTEEQVIGTFLGKPLYRKIFNTNVSITANTWVNLRYKSGETSIIKCVTSDYDSFSDGMAYPIIARLYGNYIQVFPFISITIKSYYLEYTKD